MTIAGTIEQLPSGGWSLRMPRALDPKRRRVGVYGTREEARGVSNAMLERHHAGTLQGGSEPTMRVFLAWFLDERDRGFHRDVRGDRNIAKNHIQDAEFIDWPLKSIRPVDISNWLTRLQRKHAKRSGKRLKPQTVRNALYLLRTCLHMAVAQGHIEQNPVRDVQLPRGRSATTEEPWTYLNPAEQDAFLNAMPEPERLFYAFAMGTGLRPGEQRALLAADVHLDDENPYVEVRYGKRRGPTKTGRPRRVHLHGVALEAARAEFARLAEINNPRGLMWPARHGSYRAEGAPPEWSEWLKRAGIDRRVRPYDLRHTYASSLVAGWLGRRWRLEEIKEQLGHRDIKTTQRYAHLAESAVCAAVRETQAASCGPRLVHEAGQPTEITATPVWVPKPLVGCSSQPGGAQFSRRFGDRRAFWLCRLHNVLHNGLHKVGKPDGGIGRLISEGKHRGRSAGRDPAPKDRGRCARLQAGSLGEVKTIGVLPGDMERYRVQRGDVLGRTS
jgi:integrase